MKGVKRGFTLVEIMIVILIMGILIAIAVPQFYKARESGRKSSCLANLKLIDGAKEQWAMDLKKASGAACAFSDLVGSGLYLKAQPVCPSSGTYTVGNVTVTPTCSVSGHELPSSP